MDPAQQGPTFEESIKQVMRTLPPPIRNYLGQGKYSVVAENLMNKYHLHVDQGGILEREIMLLIIGVEDPDEFIQTLSTEASLDQQTINGIVQDINQQIFIPLREEMRRGGNTQQPTPVVAASAPPQVAPRVNTTVPNYSPSAGNVSQRDVPLPPAAGPISNPSIAPLPPKMVMPSFATINPQQSTPNRQIFTVPPRRSLINLIQKPIESSSKLLEDHEEPHIDIVDTAQGVTPLGQALRRVLPPENLPGAIFHPELPKPPTPPLKPSNLPLAPSAKPYTVDPYHEPIDGK